MATPKLPFLYPNLMRAVKSCEPSTYRSIRVPSCPLPPSQAPFHSGRRHAEEAYHRRYGPAVEPHIPPPLRPKDEPLQQQASNHPLEKTNQSDPPPEQAQPRDTKSSTSDALSQQDTLLVDSSAESKSADEHHGVELEIETEPDKPETHESATASERPGEEQCASSTLQDNPLDEVIHMPSPTSDLTPFQPNIKPHMTPAPYIHHFDSYSLVRDLSKGGFTDEQSVTIMKAVRRILQNNLDFAKQNLTSKSDVENESYLFQAACSELQSSLQTSRNAETQRQRASRAHLQHESDILSQRLNQELAGLKDDIKGMFNDHKMTTRELQRSIDTSVQELNYKITVSLNSEAKSEIEGLRWILTRRAALAMATSAFMIILFLKYYSVQKQDGSEKKNKKEAPPSLPAETRTTISEFVPTPKHPGPAAHLSESLG